MKITSRFGLRTLGAACILMATTAAAPVNDAELHIARAKAAAGRDLSELLVLCQGPKELQAAMAKQMAAERVEEEPGRAPLKIFDNFYFLGSKTIGAWAVTTSKGIVLIDSMHAADVEGLVARMRQVGLDPKQIKAVLITHGHSDHFGGAKYLQETYGAQIVMSAADWDAVLNHRITGASEPPPRQDVSAPARFSLGGEIIQILPTPGHTPGAVSMLIPVREQGRRHVVALMGGLTYPKAVKDVPGYLDAHDAFAKAAAKAGADVLASNHPMNDWGLAKMRALEARKRGQPNPFVVGKDGVSRYLTVGLECARATYANQISAKS